MKGLLIINDIEFKKMPPDAHTLLKDIPPLKNPVMQTLLFINQEHCFPISYRIYDKKKVSERNKNLWDLICEAKERSLNIELIFSIRPI